MPEMKPRFRPGENVPAFAAETVTGGTFVKISDTKTDAGDYQIEPCDAGDLAFGVAEYDSAADTEPDLSVERRVNVIAPGSIARVTPGEAITAGMLIAAGTDGVAVEATHGDAILGQAVMDAAEDDDFVEVQLLFSPVPVPTAPGP